MAMDDRGGITADGEYDLAYRTACLLLGDPAAAQVAVQHAFERRGRAGGAVPAGHAGRAWLYRSLVRTCRARRVPQRISEPSQNDTGGHVVAALAALPDQLRVPLVLRFWTGLSEKEIAIAIGHRAGAVTRSLHQARQQLALDTRLSAWVAPNLEVSR